MPGYTSDILLRGLVETFIKEHSLEHLRSEDLIFKYFVNYCIASRYISGSFDFADVAVKRRNFIHGIAIVVNGRLVSSIDQLDDLIQKTNQLEIDFIFIQAKNTNKFSRANILKFGTDVEQFFNQNRLPDGYVYRRNAKPPIYHIHMYYVTMKKRMSDGNFAEASQKAINTVRYLPGNDFKNVNFHLIDSGQLRNIYRGLKNRIAKTINFAEYVPLPPTTDVEIGHTGILPCTEFLKLIIDEDGIIHRNLFHENVRDYQGDNNSVNKKITDTIRIQSRRDKFVVLNNGITIVAKSIEQVGTTFRLIDYQIVNGCQTSHVLYNNRKYLSDNIYVPLKLVVPNNPEISDLIIEGTNSQTPLAASAKPEVQPSIEDMAGFFKTTGANRETGIVDQIVKNKNYGLIQSDQGEEIYVPLRKEKTKLKKGQKVEFTVVPPPKEWQRPEARDVKVLE